METHITDIHKESNYIFSNMQTLIAYLLKNNAKESADKPAIITNDRVITHLELSNQVDKSIQYLESLGIYSGMNAALRFTDPVKHLVFYFSLLKIGVCQLTLNPNDPVDLQKKHLSLTRIDFVIQDIPMNNKLIESTLSIFEEDKLSTLVSISSTMKRSKISRDSVQAEMIVGSGTTGEPKVFLLTSSLLADRYKREMTASIFKREERHYILSELYYFDPRQVAIVSLLQGVSLLLPKSKPKCIITFCLKYKVDHLELTASQALLLLLQEKSLEKVSTLRLPQLKSLMLTSSLISEPIRKEIMEKITKELFINYGTNEFGIITIASPADVIANPGTAGTVLSGVDITIVDNDGYTCQTNDVGNIRINYKTMLSSYLNNLEATKKTFTKEGYFPGDMGRFTSDGNLIIEGRKDDMMIFSGVNIYPREMESILDSHPEVKESAVFPLNTKTHDHIPFAVVSVNHPTTEKELLHWCRLKLGWRCPKKIFFIKELPKNKTGKVLKKILAEKVIDLIVKKKSD